MLSIAPLDDLTIRLCLADDKAQAADLLQRWNREIDIDSMSFGILRLVPLIHSQITRFGLNSPHEKRLKVIYKFWWVAYQHRSNQLQKVHALLTKHDIPMLIIKGAGLIDYYDNPIHRPMADIDVLVPSKLHTKALALLLDEHWALEYPQNEKSDRLKSKIGLEPQHGMALVNTIHNAKLDLHRRIGSHTSDQVTDWVWSSTVASTTLVGLCKPAIHLELLMVVLHAVMSHFNDNLNWLIDLAHLQNKLTETDWERALEAAIAEKKSDVFLYGSHIASGYGIRIPKWLPEPQTTAIGRPNHKSVTVKKFTFAWLKHVNSGLYFVTDQRHPNSNFIVKWAMHFHNVSARTIIFIVNAIDRRKLKSSKD